MEVRGRDLIAGLPRTIPLTSSEVMEALEQPLQQIVASVRQVLEETPPELSSDIIDKGMVMSGGGAKLRNIDKLLPEVTCVPCHVAENPLNCVALGTGLALEHFDFFRKSLVQRVYPCSADVRVRPIPIRCADSRGPGLTWRPRSGPSWTSTRTAMRR